MLCFFLRLSPSAPRAAKPLLMQCDIANIGAGLVCTPVLSLYFFHFQLTTVFLFAEKQEDPEEQVAREVDTAIILKAATAADADINMESRRRRRHQQCRGDHHHVMEIIT